VVIEQVAVAIKTSAGVFFGVAQYAFTGALSSLFKVVTHLGDHMHNLLINIPRNASNNVIFAVIIEMNKFDFFPTDKFLDPIVFGDIKETPSILQVLGYETHALF
jgi:hypothetical protein